jgi:hypothetical protein
MRDCNHYQIMMPDVDKDVSIADEIAAGELSATRLRRRPGSRHRQSREMPSTCDFYAHMIIIGSPERSIGQNIDHREPAKQTKQ